MGEGCVCRELGEFLFHADHVVAIRPWTTEQQQKDIVEAALSVIGLPYNTAFDWRSHESLYCTELAVYCIEQAGIPTVPAMSSIPKNVLGLFLPFKCLRKEAWLADTFLKTRGYKFVAASEGADRYINKG